MEYPEGSAEDKKEDKREFDINKALAMANLAEDLDEDDLQEIGAFVKAGFDSDYRSRGEWEKNIDEWTKMALQVQSKKNSPWDKASNVKYPLLSTAAMQFAARAYPALVPSDGNVVKTKVIGKDEDGAKAKRSALISAHMSWQLLYQMEEWEEDMDKLLVVLPIVGTAFKKTYYDSSISRNKSCLVMPKDLVVNYWAKSLDTAERKTEVIEMSKRRVKELMLSGFFRDVELKDPENKINTTQTEANSSGVAKPTKADETTPYRILEMHTFYDLDDDEYPEPYIITIEEETRTVLRIVARYDEESITQENGKITRIKPIEYYTKFSFIPNPDGGFYDIGFGILLGSINETINSSINQTIDAGTLSNLQSGFIAKGLRMRAGELKFKPGEWKFVNASGEALKNGIVPLPVREPSTTTMALTQEMIKAGNQLASIAEIFTGKMPGQNTPATTTMATIDQSTKLFTAIHKRVYRSLEKEYKKLFVLNSKFLDEQEAVAAMDEPISKTDYDYKTHDVCPAADPTAFSSIQRLMKAQALLELLPLGTIDPNVVTMRMLEAQEQPNSQELLRKGPPPPDPKQMEMQQKAQLEQQKIGQKAQQDAFKSELAQRDSQFQQMMESQRQAMESNFREKSAILDAKIKSLEASQAFHQSEQAHQQKMRHQDEQNAAKLHASRDKSTQ